MSFKDIIFQITKSILKSTARNEIQSSLNEFKKSNIENFNNFEYAARNQYAQFAGFLAVDDNIDILNKNNPFKLIKLPENTRKWLEAGHSEIVRLNNGCLKFLSSDLEPCRLALDPYSKFKINIENQKKYCGLIEESHLAQIKDLFKEIKPVKHILQNAPKGLTNLKTENLLLAVHQIKKLIRSAGVDKAPEEFSAIQRHNNITPESLVTRFAVDLISISSVLEIVDQLIYQAVMNDNLLIINEDNIISIGSESRHALGMGIEIECQPDSNLFLAAVGSVALLDFEANGVKVHSLCHIEGESISFSQELGNSVKLRGRCLDNNLNPFFGFY